MKFEKEFRIYNPQTIGETDSHFDLQNYNEWLESKHEQLHSELEMLKTRTSLGDLAAQNCVRLEKELEKATELIKMAQNLPAEKAVEAREKFHEFMIKSTTFLENSGLNKNLK